MNGRNHRLGAIAAALATLAAPVAADPAAEPAYVNGARVAGAEPGEWTHDWDAATAAAKADGKPVFVNFTGSDWCGWCKLLKRQVFTQPEWGAWASNHVYLVHLDFPNDKALVPERCRERNRELARRYKVGGYPTCYLLDPATLEPMGRFGASRDASAADFVEKVSAAMPGAKKAPAAEERKDALRRPSSPRPAAPNAGRLPSGAVTGTAGKLPVGKLPADGRIAWFDFSEGAADKVSSGRSFDCRNVPLEDGALRFNGVYVHGVEGRTNGCNAELRVPELDYDGFTVCLSFRPERDAGGTLPLLNFGRARRWFSANVGTDGGLWFGLNCYDERIPTKGRVADGDWNWLVCSVDAVGKTVRAALNGVRLDDERLPGDFFYKILPDQAESHKTVDTTFWNMGEAFKGDIAHFILFGRPLSDGEFDAFCAAAQPSGWTAEVGPSKSLYWNATVSDGRTVLPARVAGTSVLLHPGFPEATGVVDLRGAIADETGAPLRLVGIGQEPGIGKDLFLGGRSAVAAVLLPSSLEWIGRAGFKGCGNLRTLKIPASVKSIGPDAFAGCTALERIEFEDPSFRLDDRVFGAPRPGEAPHRPATNLAAE